MRNKEFGLTQKEIWPLTLASRRWEPLPRAGFASWALMRII